MIQPSSRICAACMPLLRGLLRVPAYMLAPCFKASCFVFIPCMPFFRLGLLLLLWRYMGYVYIAPFVFCNSKCFSILYYLVFFIFFFFLTFCYSPFIIIL